MSRKWIKIKTKNKNIFGSTGVRYIRSDKYEEWKQKHLNDTRRLEMNRDSDGNLETKWDFDSSDVEFNAGGKSNGFLDFFSNLFRKWSGSAPTDSELEAAEQSQKYNLESMDYQQQLNYDMWKRTQSYEARVQDMKSAGLNPAMMMSGGAGAAPSIASSPSSSPGSVNTSGGSGLSDIMGLFSMIGNFAQLASQNKLRSSEVALNNAQAENVGASTERTKVETDILKIDQKYADIRNQIYTTEGLTRIQNNIKDIEVKDGTIRLQNSQVTLNLSDANLKNKQALVAEADKALKDLDAEKARSLLPYAVQYLKADMALKVAQTKESKANAIKLHADSLVQFAEAVIKQGLADGDYVGKFLKGLDAENALKYAQVAHEKELTTLTQYQQVTEVEKAYNVAADTDAKKAQTARDEALTEKLENENDWFVADKLLGYFGSYISAVSDGFGTMTELLVGASKLL